MQILVLGWVEIIDQFLNNRHMTDDNRELIAARSLKTQFHKGRLVKG